MQSNIVCAWLCSQADSQVALRRRVMLCVTASLIMKKICCCYFQPDQLHCDEDIAVYFYKCVYQKECLRCQVLSRKGLYEWDMLAIKI